MAFPRQWKENQNQKLDTFILYHQQRKKKQQQHQQANLRCTFNPEELLIRDISHD